MPGAAMTPGSFKKNCMWLIETTVGGFKYYLSIKNGNPHLNGLKDNAVVYPTWDIAMTAIRSYCSLFDAVLNPVAK